MIIKLDNWLNLPMARVVDDLKGAGGIRLDRLLAEVRARFTEAGLAEPSQDSRVLVTGLLGLSATDLILRGETLLDDSSVRVIEDGVDQRLKGRPVYRILGWREFYGHRFALSPETLEPRPDTETLVDETLKFVARVLDRQPGCRIVDLGVGTGAVGLSVLAESARCTCLGIDIAEGALATARTNAESLGVSDRYQLKKTSWFDGVDAAFDVIVSNPPYIERSDVRKLAREVGEHDPVVALDGGEDGLEAYRAIAAEAGGHLSADGAVLFEIGIGQGPDIAAIFGSHGFTQTGSAHDLAGIERVVVFQRA